MLTISLHTPSPSTEPPTNHFICRSCPYAFPFVDARTGEPQSFFERKSFPGKQVDDVVGGAGAQKNMAKTTVQCTRRECTSMEATYYSVQIRSADEPMTNFYTVSSSFEWVGFVGKGRLLHGVWYELDNWRLVWLTRWQCTKCGNQWRD